MLLGEHCEARRLDAAWAHLRKGGKVATLAPDQCRIKYLASLSIQSLCLLARWSLPSGW